MGVPRVPDDNYMALSHRQGGLRIKMFHLTVYPLGKQGKCCSLGVLLGGSRVPDGQYEAPCQR